jgi:predicted dehydrogenase
MRFGVIGFGNIARKLVQSITYTSNGSICAIASHSAAADDLYLKEHPQVRLYRDYEELLCDPQVEAVYIALPHLDHREWIIKSMERGIPVLCEKPMVLETGEMEEILETAARHPVYCLEAMKTKFNAGWQQLKEDLKKLGRLSQIEANFCYDSYRNYEPSSYIYDKRQGGALNDVGSYPIAFVVSLLDENVVSVTGEIYRKDGIEQYFMAELMFESGVRGVVEGAIDREKERTAVIVGELGRIEVPMFNRIQQYRIILNDGTVTDLSFPIAGDDMTMEIQAFIDDVGNGRTQSGIHSLEDTGTIVEICRRIRENAEIYEDSHH